MDKQYKTLEATDLKVEEGSQEVLAYISSDAVDRDGEIVVPKGLNKKNYGGNPIVLVNHDYQTLPIGKTLWIKPVGNKLVAKYFISTKTQLGRDVLGLMQDGVLRSHSIGFRPLEAGPPTSHEIKSSPHYADAKNVIRKWELLEFSVVSVPANPEAVALAVSKGLCQETRDFLGKDFEQQKSCWEWDAEDLEKLEPQQLNVAKVVKALDLPQTLPQPKYCRSWKSIQEQLYSIAKGLPSEAELLQRLRGKV